MIVYLASKTQFREDILSKRSEKTETENSWSHSRIRLDPASMGFNFKPLTLKPDAVNDLRMVGEYIGIIR